MPWYKVTFSPDQVADGDSDALQAQFDTLFHNSGSPPDAALFGRMTHDPPAGFEAFLSPGAVRIASDLLREYSAVPCEKPNGVSLLLGHQEALDLLK